MRIQGFALSHAQDAQAAQIGKARANATPDKPPRHDAEALGIEVA